MKSVKSVRDTRDSIRGGKISNRVKTLEFINGKLKIIDQRLLPKRLTFKTLKTRADVEDAIKTLAVRGAPAIGVAAAYGLLVEIRHYKEKSFDQFYKRLRSAALSLKRTRPTAVNLAWAVDRMMQSALANKNRTIACIKKKMLLEAKKIHRQDIKMCLALGRYGAELIKDKDVIITHCNAGALATSGTGTALAVIYEAKRQGKRIKVYADETRPLLQGARLTAWELKQGGVEVTLICDNMAAFLMKTKKVDKVIVGADRIAANGDTANKIGTYNLAVLAKEHKIPCIVVSPSSSFDFTISKGEQIPIEERAPEEVRGFNGIKTAPDKVKAWNPAFDVTPNRLISAIVTEKGIFRKPYNKTLINLKRCLVC